AAPLGAGSLHRLRRRRVGEMRDVLRCIDLGHELEPLTEEEKNENNLVRGCQSQVWMVVDGDAANVTIRANSDAAIVSGLIALVVRLYSKASAEEIIKTEPEFVEALGLSQHLSPTRANGLASMLQRLKAETAQLIAKSS
ncbi:MAG: SufE family protein, partial [Litorivicinaceae bacterium]